MNKRFPRVDRLFISDLDGTLLNPAQIITTNTKKIINRLIEKENMAFTIATPGPITTSTVREKLLILSA